MAAMSSGNIRMYRERRLARFFQNQGLPFKSPLTVGSKGVACRNVRIALRYLGFDITDSDIYDELAGTYILELQRRENHENRDGLVGPGTRALLVTALMRKSKERPFHLMTYPKGQPFPRVFVSYASEDKLAVESVVSHLDTEGVELWIDFRDLQPGERWRLAIEKAIPECRYFLALISNNALSKRGFVQKEVKTAWAVAEEYPESAIFVIPARLEECEIRNTKFAELQWIDLFPSINDGLRRIVDFLAEAD